MKKTSVVREEIVLSGSAIQRAQGRPEFLPGRGWPAGGYLQGVKAEQQRATTAPAGGNPESLSNVHVLSLAQMPINSFWQQGSKGNYQPGQCISVKLLGC